jgi:hypothetical protein
MGEALVECDPFGWVQHVDFLQKVSQLGNLNKQRLPVFERYDLLEGKA